MSRAPNRFIFEDYTPDEIVKLGENLLSKEQFKLEDKAYYIKQVKKAYAHSLEKSNGRWIRNFNESLAKEQFNRVVTSDSDDVETIRNSDIDNVLKISSYTDNENNSDALTELNQLIGIAEVKQQVKEFIYQVEANKKKEDIPVVLSS